MKKLAFATALALSATLINAAPISTTVSASANGINGSPTLLNNGVFPAEVSAWNSNATVSWKGLGKAFTFAFDDLYLVEDIRLSVDNNDSYALDYSIDNQSWTSLFTILPSYGEISWGMDTMSSVLGDAEYVSQIDFSPFAARYVRIQAAGGDNSYAIGEVAFGGTRIQQQTAQATATVPEPGMLALLGIALGAGLVARRRREA
ncbi:MAG: PEP-CTERM sorting domain-containing protein [Thauera sp.]